MLLLVVVVVAAAAAVWLLRIEEHEAVRELEAVPLGAENKGQRPGSAAPPSHENGVPAAQQDGSRE
jgi:hypothetical protein